MAEVEISYKGSNIATMNASGTKTLLTEAKYMEDDVTVTYTRPAAPSGTKNISITQNGTTTEDVTNYANAEITVNVSGGGGRDLPDDYYELAFVDTNNGGAYLVTNYTPAQGDVVRVSFSLATWSAAPILSAGSGTYQFIILCYSSGNAVVYIRNFSTNSATLGSNLKVNAWYTIQSDTNGLFTLSGDASATAISTYEGAVNSTLYVGHRAGSTQQAYGKIGRVVIENNGALKLSLIPAQRKSDDAVGFYDTVSKTFMQSYTGTAFKAGPIVLTDEEALEILLGGA